MIRACSRTATLLLISIALASGCGVQPQRASQLFVLAPLAPDAVSTGVRTTNIPPLVIGPINLPAYTERTAILRLRQQSELIAAPAARWAEPLDKNVARVLVENVSRLLGSDQVTALGGSVAPGHLQVAIDVTEFVAGDDGQVGLTTYWQILRADGRTVVASRKTHYQEALQDKSTAAVVGAMSRSLAALSRDLAQALANASTP